MDTTWLLIFYILTTVGTFVIFQGVKDGMNGWKNLLLAATWPIWLPVIGLIKIITFGGWQNSQK